MLPVKSIVPARCDSSSPDQGSYFGDIAARKEQTRDASNPSLSKDPSGAHFELHNTQAHWEASLA
jgi:hypothetical protein